MVLLELSNGPRVGPGPISTIIFLSEIPSLKHDHLDTRNH
jgi:hypothetical protein